MKFRKPHFQVPGMSRSQLPLGVLQEVTVLCTDSFHSLYSRLCRAQTFSELEQSNESTRTHTHTHTHTHRGQSEEIQTRY